ncbi:MAG: hypothetical protein FWD48_04485 [Oscillospiraceae bacterium]|nr:hypothetical protein [Oscillospiraceae bacterium]
MNCERNNGCGCDCNGGNDRREYNCRDDRRVIKHRHIVNHKHDVIHEYDVIHRHNHHTYDVVRVREEHKHHDHRRHKPEYCRENGNCGDFGNGEIEIRGGDDNDCGCGCDN